MKILLGIFLLLISSVVHADRTSYEARLGLINVGGLILFYNSRGPLSYNTLTPGELPENSVDLGIVKAKNCQHGISIPIMSNSPMTGNTSLSSARGDGSFQKAIRVLSDKNPKLQGIYDVKVDFHKTSILGIYRRVCTEITARGFGLAGSGSEQE